MTVYRAEVVGSLLRPPELVEARSRMRSSQLAPEDYRAIEDRAVDDALRLQEEVGLDVVTDGEMRRDVFFDFLAKGMSGLAPTPSYTVRFHNDENAAVMEVQIPFSVVDRIAAGPCPALDEFRYARERTSKPLKVTLPSPMMMLGFWGEASKDAYPDPLELVADAGEAVRRWIRELVDVGCTYIQIDAPDLNELYCDANVRDEWAARGIPVPELLELGTELICGFGDLNRNDTTLGMHLCRGNGTQSWIAEGGYENLSEQVFRRAGGYDVFHMEYDDDRSGGFEPLGNLPDDKIAVLGLVSTKWVRMEDPDVLKGRIGEAARFHPLEQLALAPQCGFASAAETPEQRSLTGTAQRDKLKLVADVAHEVWP